jgi:hypothetical protein
MTNRIEFSTTQYQFSHGKQPRGYGYWGFFFDGESEPQFYTGKFSDAKKTARAYAVTKGHVKIEVAP